MDYSDYPHRTWPSLASQQTSQQQVNPPFPSPVSPTPFLFPQQQPQPPQTSSAMDARPTPSSLTLNLNGLSVTSPQTLSPVAPQPGQLHPHQLHAHHPIPHQPLHAHANGSSISPITPVSPQSIPMLSPQPQFSYGFDDPAALSPNADPALNQRRPSTGSLVTLSSELTSQKSVPRKRSLTSTLPVSPLAGNATHSMHQHSQSHSYSSSQTAQALPHIITTNPSSPPPTSPASSSSHPSHSRSLSHSLSHSSLSQSRSHPQLEINTNPTSPYDDLDSAGPSFGGLGDDVSDDDLGSPSAASFSGGGPFGNASAKVPGPSGQQQTVMARSASTNNFVTKLYHMINEAKSQHYITWTEYGTSFVVSNVGEFSRSILGSHFKHNNFSSFVRQLNMYGFHKINKTPRAQRTSTSSQTWEFSHPKFLRDRPDLLEAIRRKALEPDPREKNRVELPGEVARVLNELRQENRMLWREVESLRNRMPQQGTSVTPAVASTNVGGSSQGSQSHMSPNPQVGLGSGHVLTHSRSSSNLGGDDGERDADWDDEEMNMGSSSMANIGMGMVGSQGTEEWDAQGSRFNFWTSNGVNVPGFTFNNFGAAPAGEVWKRWVESEISKEKKRVERLIGVVKTLANVSGNNSPVPTSGVAVNREPDGIPQAILHELHELSLSFETSPSPMSIPIPSPSPSPSPHPPRHQHSPNIYITSPTSPSPYPSHSRSPSRDSDTRANPNAHANLPILSIPSTTTPSQFTHPMHTPSSSPTTSDFGPNMFGQGRMMQHPNITLTLEPDEGRVEKRARTDDKGHIQMGEGPMDQSTGEEMEIVQNEGEDVKLPSPMSMTSGTSPTSVAMGAGMGCMGVPGTKVIGLRSRSDSAPMWAGAVGGETSPVQGGLSANWTGRGRSGSSYGQ